MKRYGIAAAVAGFLLLASTATVFADEPMQHDSHSGHDMMQMQHSPAPASGAGAGDANSHNMTPEEHQNMDMSGDSHDMSSMDHQNTNTSSSTGHDMSSMDHQSTDSNSHDMSSMDHQSTDSNSHDMSSMDHQDTSSDDMSSMDMSGGEAGGHSHGASGPIVETPANAAVLGTFGGIMLAFILYGALTKWRRRKGTVRA
jgi:hypothetical protein